MKTYFVIFIIFPLFLFYYFVSFFHSEFSQVFLSIATFLFAIFTGFFIARQGRRYSDIRREIAKFDGLLTSIYRFSGHLGIKAQNQAKDIIKKHYQTILKHKAWDYHFTHKSTTITSLHQLSERTAKDKSLNSLQNLSLQRILTALMDLQLTRKHMVVLHKERIPGFQWGLIIFLGVILLITLTIAPIDFPIWGAILKAAFGTSVILVIFLLYEFDKLKFFEKIIGKTSAQDILDILAGKK